MRNLLTFIFLLIGTLSYSQAVTPTGAVNSITKNKGGVQVDSALLLPHRDTTFWMNTKGDLLVRPADTGLYFKKGNRYVKLAEGSNNDSSVFVGTLAQARSLTITPNLIITKDYGGGTWFKNDTVTVDNTGTQIITVGGQGYSRVWDGATASVEWFGAISDFDQTTNIGTDNTVAVQKTIDFVAANKGGAVLFPKSYLIDSTVYINVDRQIPIYLKGSTDNARSLNTYPGPAIYRTQPGDIFRVNIKPDGSSYLAPDNQYGAFSASGLYFKVIEGVTGVTAIKQFRTRSNIKDLAGYRLDWIVYQPQQDAIGQTNYCDQSFYRNIRLSRSTLGGMQLVRNDAGEVDGFYYESPDTLTATSGLLVYATDAMTIKNVLFWSRYNAAPLAGSRFLVLNDGAGIKVSSMHVERMYFETGIDIVGQSGTSISGLTTKFSSNDMFRILTNSSNITIDGWEAFENKNDSINHVDIRSGSSGNRNINYRNCKFISYPDRIERAIKIVQSSPYSVYSGDNPATIYATNNNFTLLKASVEVILPSVSVERTITLPDPLLFRNEKITFINTSDSLSSRWKFAPEPSWMGYTLKYIPLRRSTVLYSDGTQWIVESTDNVRVTDMNNIAGVGAFYSDTSVVLNAPCPTFVVGMQFYVDNNPRFVRQLGNCGTTWYTRFSSAGVYSNWVPLLDSVTASSYFVNSDGGAINPNTVFFHKYNVVNNSNIDTIIRNGHYTVLNDAAALTMTNLPIQVQGVLEVYNLATTNASAGLRQKYRESARNITWERNKPTGSGFSSWVRNVSSDTLNVRLSTKQDTATVYNRTQSDARYAQKLTNTATIDFPSIPANSEGTGVTITVTGALTTDNVIVNAPSTTGINYKAVVTATNTVTIYPLNITTSPIDPASATFRVMVLR